MTDTNINKRIEQVQSTLTKLSTVKEKLKDFPEALNLINFVNDKIKNMNTKKDNQANGVPNVGNQANGVPNVGNQALTNINDTVSNVGNQVTNGFNALGNQANNLINKGNFGRVITKTTDLVSSVTGPLEAIGMGYDVGIKAGKMGGEIGIKAGKMGGEIGIKAGEMAGNLGIEASDRAGRMALAVGIDAANLASKLGIKAASELGEIAINQTTKITSQTIDLASKMFFGTFRAAEDLLIMGKNEYSLYTKNKAELTNLTEYLITNGNNKSFQSTVNTFYNNFINKYIKILNSVETVYIKTIDSMVYNYRVQIMCRQHLGDFYYTNNFIIPAPIKQCKRKDLVNQVIANRDKIVTIIKLFISKTVIKLNDYRLKIQMQVQRIVKDTDAANNDSTNKDSANNDSANQDAANQDSAKGLSYAKFTKNTDEEISKIMSTLELDTIVTNFIKKFEMSINNNVAEEKKDIVANEKQNNIEVANESDIVANEEHDNTKGGRSRRKKTTRSFFANRKSNKNRKVKKRTRKTIY